MPREFKLPDLGEGITEAQIIRLQINTGDTVAEDQPLMEVETDKAAVEIPSPFAGVAKKVHVKEGQTVNVGDVIVTFDGGTGETQAEPARKEAPRSSVEAPARAAAAAGRGGSSRDDGGGTATAVAEAPSKATGRKTTAPAAPAVRKLARELGVDLDSIRGSGPGGRVTREDVEATGSGPGKKSDAGKAAAPAPSETRRQPQPSAPPPGVPDKDKWGGIRREPLSQIRKTIANQMSRSAFTAVHVTHNDDVDITELERVRRHLNELTDNNPKLTVMTFVIRACCIALRKYPIFNSSFDAEGGQIVYKDYVNIGVAVDTERGLVVPVIRNADGLSLRGIAAELRSIADRVRSNRFEIEDLRGGTFTITNVGALGGMVSTPIINYPEVAILGLGRSRKAPVVKDDQIVPGLLLPMNLSFDHRAADGANAARFTGEIIDYLQHPARFMLD